MLIQLIQITPLGGDALFTMGMTLEMFMIFFYNVFETNSSPKAQWVQVDHVPEIHCTGINTPRHIPVRVQYWIRIDKI